MLYKTRKNSQIKLKKSTKGKKLFELPDRDMICNGFLEDDFAEVYLNNKISFINNKGQEIIPCIYDTDFFFEDNISTVCCNNKYGAIDLSGKTVIPFEYKKLSYSEGLFLAQNTNGEFGYIDINNDIIIPFGKYIDGNNFSGGYAVVSSKEKGNIYIDKLGKELEIRI